jgi:hypothetical protein
MIQSSSEKRPAGTKSKAISYIITNLLKMVHGGYSVSSKKMILYDVTSILELLKLRQRKREENKLHSEMTTITE